LATWTLLTEDKQAPIPDADDDLGGGDDVQGGKGAEWWWVWQEYKAQTRFVTSFKHSLL